MAKRSSKKREHDLAVNAFRVMQEATGQAEEPEEKPLDTEGKNPAAVALGRLGGKKGGLARAAKLSESERTRIAKLAAAARWSRRET